MFAAARGLAQPIILSIGTVFASFYGNSNSDDGNTIDTAIAPYFGGSGATYGKGLTVSRGKSKFGSSKENWGKEGKNYSKKEKITTDKIAPEKKD